METSNNLQTPIHNISKNLEQQKYKQTKSQNNHNHNEQTNEKLVDQVNGDSSQSQQNQNNASLPNKKHKRKHKKRKIHHPPQYYEQIKTAKINQARETHWNNRFAYDTIPQALRMASFNKKSKTSHQKFRLHKQKDRSPIILTLNNNSNHKKTLNTLNKNHILPAIFKDKIKQKQQKSKTHQSKSFQIRTQIKDKKQEENSTISHNNQNINQKEEKEKQVLDSQNIIKGTKIQMNQETQKYIKEFQKIQSQYNPNQFPLFCKELITQLAYKVSSNKNIKKYLDQQFKKLKQKRSQANQTWKIINIRQKLLKEMKGQVDSLKITKLSQYNTKQYRQVTLKVIQQILKWREEGQNVLKIGHIKKKKLNIVQYEGQSYSSKIGRDIEFLNIKKQNQKIVDPRKDPFLIGCLQKEDKSLILKIRACQLLLLQQKLNEQLK